MCGRVLTSGEIVRSRTLKVQALRSSSVEAAEQPGESSSERRRVCQERDRNKQTDVEDVDEATKLKLNTQ